VGVFLTISISNLVVYYILTFPSSIKNRWDVPSQSGNIVESMDEDKASKEEVSKMIDGVLGFIGEAE